jgi:DNA-binding transcriptional ArsR family regulator
MAITLTPARATGIEFTVSPVLDLLNAMYFTSIAEQLEGAAEWPTETRARMDRGLRGELDLLFSYPRGEPGIMGALNDTIFFHRDAWRDVEALLRFVRELPAEGTADPHAPGIQGLALYALRWPGHQVPYEKPRRLAARDALEMALGEEIAVDASCATQPSGDIDAAAVMALFDDVEGVRARMLRLIRAFYDEYYRPEEAARLAALRRAVDAHERDRGADAEELTRRLLNRPTSCLETVCKGPYEQYIFVPSIDVGIYNSCIDYGRLHALYYQCEAQFRGVPDTDDVTQRMALVYRALSDEGRLRILHLLHGGELYAQEIIERTGLHQSVVSRHLSFMKAVGLVNVRKQNNMKFYSLNEEAGEELRRAVDVFLPRTSARSGYQATQKAP